MYYSGFLTVQSHKMVKIQVVPEKSEEVFDLTGWGRVETQLCVYSSRGEQKAAVFREIIMYNRRLRMKEGENELLIKGLSRKKTVLQ